MGPAIIVLGVVYFWLRFGTPLKKLGLMNGSGEILWEKLGSMEKRQADIEKRQFDLRDKLPEEYVRNDRLSGIEKRLEEIGHDLSSFIADCRRGNCAAGRLKP